MAFSLQEASESLLEEKKVEEKKVEEGVHGFPLALRTPSGGGASA